MVEKWIGVAMFAIAGSCTGSQPAGGTCTLGIHLRVTVPCCDAHNAQAMVTYPSGAFDTYDLDTGGVISGGTIDETLPFPQGVTAGDAQVGFYADGDGSEIFGASETASIAPGSCTDVTLTATTNAVDAGP